MAVEQDMLVMRDWNLAKMVHDGELVSMEMDTYKDLAMIAKIGAEGVHQQNCLRDLHRQLPRSSIEMPPPIKIPLKIMPGDPPEIKLTDQCVMLPHVLFAHIFHTYKNVWEGRFVPSTEQLNAFWDAQEGNPQLDHEDLRDRSDLRDRCVPLRMHSDGVVATGRGRSWSKMLDVFSWGPVLGWGKTDTMLYFIWAVWEHQVAKLAEVRTYDVFARIMRWSFTALWHGKWPTHDHNGIEYPAGTRAYELAHDTVHLADGYFATLWVIESDLDFLAVFWNFPRTNAGCPCAFCECTNLAGTMPWNDFRLAPMAPWMSLIRNVAYMKANPHLFPNPMYDIPAVSPMTVCIDWMHTKYLGTDQYFLGSVLYVLCTFLMPSAKPEENCAKIWQDVKTEYTARSTPSRYRVLKMNMFSSGSGGYPQLKGKAAAIQHLGLILRDIFARWCTPGDLFHKAILGALDSSARLEEILYVYKDQFKFPDGVGSEFRDLCLKHVKQQQELKDFAGHRIFNVTFKHHWLIHAGQRGMFQNPRMGWCFQGEDLMMKIRTVTHPCTYGIQPEAVHQKLLDRMIRNMDTAFTTV